MELGLDTIINSGHWQKMFDLLPAGAKNPYLGPGYHAAYKSVEGHAMACFWIYEDERNFIFYPFIKRGLDGLGYDLESGYFDVSGVYGYNGPAGIVTDTCLIEQFNRELLNYMQDNRIVTELVKYCPITGNKDLHSYTEKIHVLDNVFVDLSRGLDWIWDESFEYRVRKSVRKGESYSLVSEFKRGSQIDEEFLNAFYGIYVSTMQRREADDFYFFNLDFFWDMIKNMGDMVLLALTRLGNVFITGELLLAAGSTAYGFLGGTLGDYYQYKANTYQRWQLISHLHGLGFQKYSMGGGASRGDSIYSFKKSFVRNCENPFYIGTKVHLPDVYAKIQSQWHKMYPEAAKQHDNKIQGYRIRS
jgi:serine/alanine adding enzyme